MATAVDYASDCPQDEMRFELWWWMSHLWPISLKSDLHQHASRLTKIMSQMVEHTRRFQSWMFPSLIAKEALLKDQLSSIREIDVSRIIFRLCGTARLGPTKQLISWGGSPCSYLFQYLYINVNWNCIEIGCDDKFHVISFINYSTKSPMTPILDQLTGLDRLRFGGSTKV